MAVSLRLSPQLKRRVARVAKRSDSNPHAFMLAAIREKLEAEEAQAAFVAEAERRLARMVRSGVGIPADDVFDYLEAWARGEKVKRPRARKLR
jgi:predicted transcriptional regulator